MRNIILMAMALLMGMTLSAQTLFHKDDVKRLRKLVKQEKVRTPLPMLMSDDQACVDELHDMYKWDAQAAKLKAAAFSCLQQELA